MIDIEKLSFLQNDKWYTKNEKGEILLTSLAPQKAKQDYKKAKQDYQNKLNKDNNSMELFMEDSWLKFPLDEDEPNQFSVFGENK